MRSMVTEFAVGGKLDPEVRLNFTTFDEFVSTGASVGIRPYSPHHAAVP
jgi:hypothetical protein